MTRHFVFNHNKVASLKLLKKEFEHDDLKSGNLNRQKWVSMFLGHLVENFFGHSKT
jgi:hypothetical protein